MNKPYKMILVDDEDEERGRISSKISEQSGFTVVATAGNGYDALELIEKHQPDIVLTDIKMPFIDGIELASLIRQDWPTVRIAFITGFDEFEYARKAIDLQASGFLMKPVTQEDFSAFLDRLRADLDEEFRMRYDLNFLKSRYERILPLVLDDSFISLLTGSRPVTERELADLSEAGLTQDGSLYALAILEIQGIENKDLEAPVDSFASARLELPIRSITEDILTRHGFVRYSTIFNETVVFAVRDPGANFMKKLDNVLYETVRMVERYLSASVSFGVSNPFDVREGLHAAWQDADRALSFARCRGASRIVYASELIKTRPVLPFLADTDARSLELVARNGSDDDLRCAIEVIRSSVFTDETADLRLFALTLFSSAVRFAESIGVDPSLFFESDTFARVLSPSTDKAACDWAFSVFSAIRASATEKRKTSAERFVDGFIALIAERYADPFLSLDTVCDALSVSASYISLLLKRHLDTTFTAYLTSIRMEKAKDLLRYSNSLVLEIAEKCGYRDVYYFSHIFKKFTGYPPKRYREKLST